MPDGDSEQQGEVPELDVCNGCIAAMSKVVWWVRDLAYAKMLCRDSPDLKRGIVETKERAESTRDESLFENCQGEHVGRDKRGRGQGLAVN